MEGSRKAIRQEVIIRQRHVKQKKKNERSLTYRETREYSRKREMCGARI